MVSDHEDAEHPRHDANENCVMHWTYESGKLAKFIQRRLNQGNTSLDVFDQACKDDVAAMKGTK